MRLALHIGFFVLCSQVPTAAVMAQPSKVQGIYTCIDAAGRRFTADRPIVQCADREQRVLGPTGVERTRVGPALTELEMAQRLEQQRQEQSLLQRTQEQRRRDAVLLMRYPDRASHDAARRNALLQIEALQKMALKQMQALQQDNEQLQQELAFYQQDAAKVPARLRAAVQDNEKAQRDQQAVLAAQDQEVQRVHQRLDAELERLQPLWQSRQPEAPMQTTQQ